MTPAHLAPHTAQRRRRIVDEYLVLLAAQHGSENALEVSSHLSSFFAEVNEEPDDVSTAEVLDFLRRQRLAAGGDATRARLIEQRLRSVISLFIYAENGTITDPLAPSLGRTVL